MNVAMLLNCGSFEGYFGWFHGLNRDQYVRRYRDDWAWYYARGLLAQGLKPVLYIPALYEAGKDATDVGIDVRFLPLAPWYRHFERIWLKRMARTNRWSLYADERLQAVAMMRSLRQALADDRIQHLYLQEYWNARFDHIVGRVDVPTSGADHGGVPTGVLKWFKRVSFARAAALYCQSEHECRTVAAYGGTATFHTNGCDLAYFFPDPAVPRRQTILTVARLTDRQKRTSDLVRALQQLPDAWTLDIVGRGPDKDKVEALAVELGVRGRVRFHGFLGRPDIRDLLRRCGVYAMPSSHEAVAVAALEAMGCGAAVVLSRIRTFEQLVDGRSNGLLVPVGDVEQLAATILKAWEDREALGRAAVDTVRARYDTRVLYRELADSIRRARAPARGSAGQCGSAQPDHARRQW